MVEDRNSDYGGWNLDFGFWILDFGFRVRAYVFISIGIYFPTGCKKQFMKIICETICVLNFLPFKNISSNPWIV